MNDEIALSIRRYIGARIKYARSLADLTQTELAADVNAHAPDFAWTREIVTNIERGRRGVNIEELCVIASVQQRPVGWYFADAPASLREHIPGYLDRGRDGVARRRAHGAPAATGLAA